MLGVGLVVRILVEVAYWPALFYGDSWGYLKDAYSGFPAGFEPARPSGYPALLRLIMWSSRETGLVTVLQHVAGLATVVLVYALCVRLGVGRRWSAVVAAVLVLDAWTLALEQRVLSETFFTLTLVVVAYLAVSYGDRRWAIVAAGVLAGAAATLRGVAVFVVPVLLIYLAWRHRSLVAPLIAAAAVALPLVLYGAAHKVVLGDFALTESSGWFLYGRVAEFADCSRSDVPVDSRFLCQPPGDPDRKLGAAFYIWDPSSPANERLGLMGARADSNRVLRGFAKAVIRDQPGDYARVVVADVARFFEPGHASLGASDDALVLPRRPGEAFQDDPAHKLLIPDYRPPARPPAAALHAYAGVVHLPRPLLALAALLGVLAVIVRRDKDVFLLVGMGLALLIGAAGTSDFVLRYLLPAAPLLLAGGAVGLRALVAGPRALTTP